MCGYVYVRDLGRAWELMYGKIPELEKLAKKADAQEEEEEDGGKVCVCACVHGCVRACSPCLVNRVRVASVCVNESCAIGVGLTGFFMNAENTVHVGTFCTREVEPPALKWHVEVYVLMCAVSTNVCLFY